MLIRKIALGLYTAYLVVNTLNFQGKNTVRVLNESWLVKLTEPQLLGTCDQFC